MEEEVIRGKEPEQVVGARKGGIVITHTSKRRVTKDEGCESRKKISLCSGSFLSGRGHLPASAPAPALLVSVATIG